MNHNFLIYRRKTLLENLGISETTLRNWMLNEGFPHPIKLGPRAVGWVASQVQTWVEARPTTSPMGAESKNSPT